MWHVLDSDTPFIGKPTNASVIIRPGAQSPGLHTLPSPCLSSGPCSFLWVTASSPSQGLSTRSLALLLDGQCPAACSQVRHWSPSSPLPTSHGLRTNSCVLFQTPPPYQILAEPTQMPSRLLSVWLALVLYPSSVDSHFTPTLSSSSLPAWPSCQ